MNQMQRSKKIQQAANLIAIGFRTTIVSYETDLPIHLIRSLYKTINGKPPSAGGMPMANTIVKNRQALLEASLFIVIYINIQSDFMSKGIDIERLISAYQLYITIRQDTFKEEKASSQLSINDSWVIARAVLSGEATLHQCNCDSSYLTVSNQHTQLKCPCCSLFK